MALLLSEAELARTQPAERAASHSPVPTQIVSNGEFNPLPLTAQQRRVESRIKEIADALAPKLGFDRRQVLRTGCGMATAFLAMNDVFGPLFAVNRAEAAEPAIPHVKPSDNSPQAVRVAGAAPSRLTYCLFCYDIWYDDDAPFFFAGHIGLDFEAHVDEKGKTRPGIRTGGSDPRLVKELEDGVKERLKGTNKVRGPKPDPTRPDKIIVYKTLDKPTKKVQLCFLVEVYGRIGEGPCPPPDDVLISLEQMVTDGDPATPDKDKRDSNGRFKPEYDPQVPKNWTPKKWRDGTLSPGDADKPEDDKYDHRRKIKGPKFM